MDAEGQSTTAAQRLVEIVAQSNLEAAGVWGDTLTGSGIGAALTSSFGVAALLRVAGGVALLVGTRMITSAVRPAAVPLQELVSVGSGSDLPAEVPPVITQLPTDRVWQPVPASSVALAGAGLILLSHVFAGHTVTEGFRLLTGLLDVIHVGAGAVWAGGLVMIIVVSWRRYQDDRDLRPRNWPSGSRWWLRLPSPP